MSEKKQEKGCKRVTPVSFPPGKKFKLMMKSSLYFIQSSNPPFFFFWRFEELNFTTKKKKMKFSFSFSRQIAAWRENYHQLTAISKVMSAAAHDWIITPRQSFISLCTQNTPKNSLIAKEKKLYRCLTAMKQILYTSGISIDYIDLQSKWMKKILWENKNRKILKTT